MSISIKYVLDILHEKYYLRQQLHDYDE